VTDEAAQMGTNFEAARHLTRAQNDRNRPAALGIVDMDRQKAVLVVMSVEQ
jgi:hypothetical protein